MPSRQGKHNKQQSLALLWGSSEGTTICVMSASEPAKRPRHRQNSWPVVLYSHLSVATRVRRRRRAKKLTSGAPFLFGSGLIARFSLGIWVCGIPERAPPPGELGPEALAWSYSSRTASVIITNTSSISKAFNRMFACQQTPSRASKGRGASGEAVHRKNQLPHVPLCLLVWQVHPRGVGFTHMHWLARNLNRLNSERYGSFFFLYCNHNTIRYIDGRL